MTPLQARKQLLLAESELNRAQAAIAATSVKEAVQKLAARSAAIAIVSSPFAALRTFRTPAVSKDKSKLSWIERILKVAALAGAL